MITYWAEKALCDTVDLLWSGFDEVGRGIACSGLIRCVVVWTGSVLLFFVMKGV